MGSKISCTRNIVLHEIIHCTTFSLFSLSEPINKNFMQWRGFIIEIYWKRAQSMKMSCNEISCNLQSVRILCSENFMKYSIYKYLLTWLTLVHHFCVPCLSEYLPGPSDTCASAASSHGSKNKNITFNII